MPDIKIGTRCWVVDGNRRTILEVAKMIGYKELP